MGNYSIIWETSFDLKQITLSLKKYKMKGTYLGCPRVNELMGKLLKKQWCCISGGYYRVIWGFQLSR